MPKSNDSASKSPARKASKPRVKRQKKPAPPARKELPQYKVLLHNDEINEAGYVVRVICTLTPLSTEESVERMQEAHTTGVSLLLVTHKERAELYEEQFMSCRLKVTIEPAE